MVFITAIENDVGYLDMVNVHNGCMQIICKYHINAEGAETVLDFPVLEMSLN